MDYGLKTKDELIIELKELRQKYKRLKAFFESGSGMNILRGTETILVLDDNEPARKTFAQMIEKYGYTVLQASSSENALKIMETYDQRIHLVLSDIVMPKENGPEAVKKILKINPQIKVIYMSGYANDEIMIEDISKLIQNEVPLIFKPFSLEDIGILLKQQLTK